MVKQAPAPAPPQPAPQATASPQPESADAPAGNQALFGLLENGDYKINIAGGVTLPSNILTGKKNKRGVTDVPVGRFANAGASGDVEFSKFNVIFRRKWPGQDDAVRDPALAAIGRRALRGGAAHAGAE